ncbi:hypothetical protein [Marinomonas posidonica]|uniref:Uncharacterized protein n=1 Tax=Marinomonas posidonica (strain CECT 7376 / NCIMB 14433 / IVIA-Po-181) TaxID=491952 RepID=F6CTX5_MARPP|nr:hypothetical protein [Marinomonas posidonica]AEF56344.1 hypothetical protein Mar181_3326 [Marinomonas posidonica IVIA-Po-181]
MISANIWFLAILTWLFSFGFSNNGAIATATSVTLVILLLAYFSLKMKIQRKRYSKSDFNDQYLKEIKEVMKEPKGIELSAYEERVRRNLLVVSFFALAFISLDLQINSESKLLGGITFSNLTPNKVYILLILIIGYELVHYVWNLITSFMHWRVRLTGVSTIELRGNVDAAFSSSNITPLDHTGKDENSNLYVWMFEQALQPKDDVNTSLQATHSTLEKVTEELQKNEQNSNTTHLETILKTLNGNVQSLNINVIKLIELAEHKRIDGSLLYFDQWFKLLKNSKNIQWIFLDFLLPISLGTIAIILLITEIT